ncbi:MAG: glycosyltransferase family 39 protein [Bdellovibrionota bacterium]|nr:MAG: glycosyltransferase family 39 protein [Bdellovibrionota bacterium]
MRTGLLLSVGIALQVAAIIATAPYGASLWIDEILSAWITDGSLGSAVSRSLTYQGQSPLFFILLWLLRCLPMPLEISLRLLSVLSGVMAGWGLWRVVDDRRERMASLWAVVLFLTIDAVLVSGMSARPYMLALALVVWSFHSFQAWLKDGSPTQQWIFIGCTVAAFYTHYLFVGVLLIEIIWWYVYKPRRTIVGDKRAYIEMVGSVGCIAALCLPGLYQLIQLFYRTQELTFAAPPDAVRLLSILFPPLCLIGVAIAVVLASLSQNQPVERLRNTLQRPFVICCLFWHIFPPIVFFTWSLSGGPGLFLERYFLWHSIGLVLALAIIMAEIVPQAHRVLAIGCVVGLSIISNAARSWKVEDWRGALRAVERRENAPLVLLYTGLIEAERSGFARSIDHREYLLAPVHVYAPALQALPIPFTIGTERHRDYRNEQLLPSLQGREQVTLVAVDKEVLVDGKHTEEAVSALEKFLAAHGFIRRSSEHYGAVQVVELRREGRHDLEAVS